MTPALLTTREHLRFEAAGRRFVCLVPSAATFALDEAADAILRLLSVRAYSREALVRALADGDLDSSIDELIRMRVIDEVAPRTMPKIVPLQPFPLAALALNVTKQCNLAYSYWYEYGACVRQDPL